MISDDGKRRERERTERFMWWGWRGMRWGWRWRKVVLNTTKTLLNRFSREEMERKSLSFESKSSSTSNSPIHRFLTWKSWRYVSTITFIRDTHTCTLSVKEERENFPFNHLFLTSTLTWPDSIDGNNKSKRKERIMFNNISNTQQQITVPYIIYHVNYDHLSLSSLISFLRPSIQFLIIFLANSKEFVCCTHKLRGESFQKRKGNLDWSMIDINHVSNLVCHHH